MHTPCIHIYNYRFTLEPPPLLHFITNGAGIVPLPHPPRVSMNCIQDMDFAKRIRGSGNLKRTVLANLPQWGAILSALILIVAVVIRPCTKLLYISSVHMYEHVSGNAASAAATSALNSDRACFGESAMLAIKHINTSTCPIDALSGRPCIKHLDVNKVTANFETADICKEATPSFRVATQRLIEWFEPFQRNGSVTCAHTAWFNMTPSSVSGVVTNTMFGDPVVLWYPSVVRPDRNTSQNNQRDMNTASSKKHPHAGKLSLIVFSHLSQREELLTYPSVVEISHLSITTKKHQGGDASDSLPKRKMLRFTGAVAHCVQWLIDVYQ